MDKVRISIIAAIDDKRGLGKNNQLLFKIPEDFKRMKVLTTGHPIIMGRKTFESIGRVLTGRTNIIVTRDKAFDVAQDKIISGAEVVHSLEQAIEVAKKSTGSDEIFIFGGGQIFEQGLPLTDRLYLTIVKGDFGADTFFPDYSAFTKKVFEEKHSNDGYEYSFLTLEK